MFGLLGIKQISIWVKNQDLKKLKKQAYGVVVGGIITLTVANGGNLPATHNHSQDFNSPVVPIERVVNRDDKVSETGSGILIGNQSISEG